jgi:hypothetical protein
LAERYASLSDAIARSLLDLYASRAKAEEDRPTPRTAEELLAMTQLNWVEICRDGGLKLGYGFRESVGGNDAVFTVRIKDWRPSGESLDEDEGD